MIKYFIMKLILIALLGTCSGAPYYGENGGPIQPSQNNVLAKFVQEMIERYCPDENCFNNFQAMDFYNSASIEDDYKYSSASSPEIGYDYDEQNHICNPEKCCKFIDYDRMKNLFERKENSKTNPKSDVLLMLDDKPVGSFSREIDASRSRFIPKVLSEYESKYKDDSKEELGILEQQQAKGKGATDKIFENSESRESESSAEITNEKKTEDIIFENIDEHLRQATESIQTSQVLSTEKSPAYVDLVPEKQNSQKEANISITGKDPEELKKSPEHVDLVQAKQNTQKVANISIAADDPKKFKGVKIEQPIPASEVKSFENLQNESRSDSTKMEASNKQLMRESRPDIKQQEAKNELRNESKSSSEVKTTNEEENSKNLDSNNEKKGVKLITRTATTTNSDFLNSRMLTTQEPLNIKEKSSLDEKYELFEKEAKIEQNTVVVDQSQENYTPSFELSTPRRVQNSSDVFQLQGKENQNKSQNSKFRINQNEPRNLSSMSEESLTDEQYFGESLENVDQSNSSLELTVKAEGSSPKEIIETLTNSLENTFPKVSSSSLSFVEDSTDFEQNNSDVARFDLYADKLVNILTIKNEDVLEDILEDDQVQTGILELLKLIERVVAQRQNNTQSAMETFPNIQSIRDKIL